jgi:hypothetical protein
LQIARWRRRERDRENKRERESERLTERAEGPDDGGIFVGFLCLTNMPALHDWCQSWFIQPLDHPVTADSARVSLQLIWLESEF